MRRIPYFLIIMILLIISCSEQPEFNNLFDPDCEIPAPNNLTYALENYSWPLADIHLVWEYDALGIDGFKVKKNGTLLTEIIPVGNTEWTDIGVNIENNNYYQVLAFYQSNNSDYSNELIVPAISCMDIDGNVYQTLVIGDQEWMIENLKVTHYTNGDPIAHLTDDGDWTSTTSGAYCVYDNNTTNADTYGNLYNWFAVDDSRGLAPEGWHVSTDEEIMELEMYLGMSYSEAHDTGYRGTNEGSKLAGRADLWANGALENDPEFGSSGFDFLPGGYRNFDDGTFGNLGSNGYFWSATESNTYSAWRRGLYYSNARVYRYYSNKPFGYSVRCVRD